MGVVFEAVDPRLQRTVALKVILDGKYLEPRHTARFQTEATSLAQLRHPNIVQIHEINQHHGRPYFALEYVAGGSLADFLANRPQPVRDCAVITRSLAIAVQHAHERRIVHRGLKPANVLLSRNPLPTLHGESANSERNLHLEYHVAKIADFGLARQREHPGLTQTGELLGTPGTMAPEMTLPFRGERWAGRGFHPLSGGNLNLFEEKSLTGLPCGARPLEEISGGSRACRL
jgi:serine/threonine-protein kinase